MRSFFCFSFVHRIILYWNSRTVWNRRKQKKYKTNMGNIGRKKWKERNPAISADLLELSNSFSFWALKCESSKFNAFATNLDTWLDKEYGSTEHWHFTFLCNWYSGEWNLCKQTLLKYWDFSPLYHLLFTKKRKGRPM